MLQDLDNDQIADFVRRWHDTTVADARDRQFKHDRLGVALRESRAIRELAGNPLLITMMAILNRNQELPRDRVQLYEKAAEVLLHRWDAERALESHPQFKDQFGHKEKAAVLRLVASTMQTAPPGLAGNIVSGDDLERLFRDYLKNELNFAQPHAAARALLAQLRERNFILCNLGAERYAFVHRTFLEYFCAAAVVQQFGQNLSLEFLRTEICAAHWRDESWHEVLCLVAGMVANLAPDHVAVMIDSLLDQPDKTFQFHQVFLAARCYLEVRNPTSLHVSRQRVTAALETLVSFDFPYGYESWSEEEKRRIRLHSEAVALLAKIQPSDQALAWLREHARLDGFWDVRQAAVAALAQGWREDAGTLVLLRERAVQDEDKDVRQAAVAALAQGWREDAGTLALLRERAVQDEVKSTGSCKVVRQQTRHFCGIGARRSVVSSLPVRPT